MPSAESRVDMIIVIPCHSGDANETIELIHWIKQLGGCPRHEALLVFDAGISMVTAMDIREACEGAFRDVRLVTNSIPVSGWPLGPNSLFLTAMQNAEREFLWLEPDAIPLVSNWADKIEEAYRQCGKLIMGCIYDGETAEGTHKFMSGVAVYPRNASAIIQVEEKAWDQTNREVMLAEGAHTQLIKHFFGTHKVPPSFVNGRSETTRAHESDPEELLKSGRVIFHRNKDGSLRRILQKRMFGAVHRKPIKVVFPVCNKDIHMALELAKWLQRISNPRWPHEAVVAFDKSSAVAPINLFEQMLRNCFEKVTHFVYDRPPFDAYPQAANWAFQNVAYHMMKQDHSWLWFEADAIALKPDWLAQLQREYEHCCRDFMGPIVPHMGHLQGTAIYPPDTPSKMRGAMMTLEAAFDMNGNVSHLAHDSKLFCHLWTLMNRRPHPVGGGEVPAGITAAELASWLPREAVFLHRIKDNSVLRILMNGEFRP